jgi:hypothetical protein
MMLRIPGSAVTSTGEVPTTFEIDVTSYCADGEGNIAVEVGDSLTIRFRDPLWHERDRAAQFTRVDQEKP